MWGLFVFAPFFGDHVQPLPEAHAWACCRSSASCSRARPWAWACLTAGVILAVMIIPFISSVMRDVFEIVPAVLKESAYGLGCTKWEVVRKIVLPYTRGGVVGGVMLGLGRALGETMAVTFVIGNANDTVDARCSRPGNTISSTLANEFGEASSHAARVVAVWRWA